MAHLATTGGMPLPFSRLNADMPVSNDPSDPDKPQPGLPSDWAMSRVAQAAARPEATQPLPPTAPFPPPRPAAVEPAVPAGRPAAPEYAAPQTVAVDPRIFGAIGQWQERQAYQQPARRAPQPAPAPAQEPRPAVAVPAESAPVIDYGVPLAHPPALPTVELRQPDVRSAPQPLPPPQLPQTPAEPPPLPPTAEPPRPVRLSPAEEQFLGPETFVPSEAIAQPLNERRSAGMLSSLWLWRGIAVVFVVLSVVLAVLLLTGGPSFDIGLAPIGQVNSPAPIFLVESGKDRLRLTALADIDVPKDRDLQLWMFQPNSDRAISLGVLPPDGGIFTPPVAAAEGTRFVISLEPHGGSTGGKIAGKVLYGGTLANR
jgi:hypothetical protein